MILDHNKRSILGIVDLVFFPSFAVCCSGCDERLKVGVYVCSTTNIFPSVPRSEENFEMRAEMCLAYNIRGVPFPAGGLKSRNYHCAPANGGAPL